ncbi:MAG: hypothetical protein JXQ84_01205 [Rhodospirillaceae bacterium]|nr:hypothetical protein [Rhodospirillaceae bacterium]
MRRGGKIGVAVAVVGLLAFGGFKAFEQASERRVRDRVDTQLAQMGLTDAVHYGGVTVEPFSRTAALSDLTFSEKGVVVFRVDRVEVGDFQENDQGQPQSAVIGVRGLHLAFAQWIKDCAEKGVSCPYAVNAKDVTDNGIDEILVDMDLSYHMDEAAKRFRLAGGLSLKGFVAFAFKATVGGLDSATLHEVGLWSRDVAQSGVPPMLALAVFGQTVGKKINHVELSALGFAMTDLGGVRRHAEMRAKETDDRRPVDDIIKEQVAEVQADIRGGAQTWMPQEFIESMASALEPFAYKGKPYRIATTATAPVVVLKRGSMGLEAGPDLTDPARLFQALALKVDNAPL